MAKEKSKESKVKRIDKQLNMYLDNPDHKNARKLLARQAYLTGKSFSNQKIRNKHGRKSIETTGTTS
jgi:hypothetical protein